MTKLKGPKVFWDAQFFESFFWILISCLLQKRIKKQVHFNKLLAFLILTVSKYLSCVKQINKVDEFWRIFYSIGFFFRQKNPTTNKQTGFILMDKSFCKLEFNSYGSFFLHTDYVIIQKSRAFIRLRCIHFTVL